MSLLLRDRSRAQPGWRGALPAGEPPGGDRAAESDLGARVVRELGGCREAFEAVHPDASEEAALDALVAGGALFGEVIGEV